MPRQAHIAQHLSVLRGVRAASPDHVYDEVFTAFPRGTPRPAFGSLVSRFSPAPACGLPAYVGLSRPLPAEQPLYAGAAHAPFRLRQEAIADLGRSVPLSCLQDRRALLHGFDTLRRDLDGGAMAAMDQHTAAPSTFSRPTRSARRSILARSPTEFEQATPRASPTRLTRAHPPGMRAICYWPAGWSNVASAL